MIYTCSNIFLSFIKIAMSFPHIPCTINIIALKHGKVEDGEDAYHKVYCFP